MSEKHNTEGDDQLPAIVVDEVEDKAAQSSDEQGANGNVPLQENNKASSEHGGVRKKKKSKPVPGQMPMPSRQAGKLTTAFNNLVRLQKAKKVENIAYNAVEDAEKQLLLLRQDLDAIRPENDLQQCFKDSWIAKNVTRKEEYIIGLKKALLEAKALEDDELDAVSQTSSERQAAAEEEALLLLEQEQLMRRQALRQRQREEELREQAERDELQMKLLEVRSRASSRAPSRAPSRASVPLNNQVPNLFGAGETLRLPEIGQNTQEWLDRADDLGAIRRAQSAPQGGGELMRQMLLAQVKVPQFKGDQLEYLWFRQSFEVQVEGVTTDPVQRLYHLMQALEGEPLRLVRGCQLAPNPHEGFRRAKELLNQRYGHPVRQTLAFKEKLLAWPPIKSTQDLTDFYIHLQQCQQVKLGGGLAELDAASTVLALARKLPARLQSSWQTRVVDLEAKELRPVDFTDFVQYVQRQEMARSHPVFGKLGGEKAPDAWALPAKARAMLTDAKTMDEEPEEVVLKTGAELERDSQVERSRPNAFTPPCLFCKGDHWTSKCEEKDLTCEQKKARLRGLCFSCLKPGHSARYCKSRARCERCNGAHPTVLHEERNRQKEEHPEETKEPDAAAKEKNFLTLGNPRFSMATVKVRLWADQQASNVTITALLDAASSATFISQELADALKVPTREMDLQLSTMAGTTSSSTRVVQGLRVADIDLNNAFSVGIAYVVNTLPDVGRRLTNQDLNRWSHLQDVPLSDGEGPVHMLIGQNVLGVHTPDEVKRGSDDEPFAVKTKLGWTIMGPLPTGKMANRTEIVNFTKVRHQTIERQLQMLFYSDFQAAHDFSKRGPSREDRQWLSIVEQSAHHLPTGHMCIELPLRQETDQRLQDNRDQAMQRLKGLQRKFAAQPQFHRDYAAFVDKMIKSGHAEPVRDPTQLPNSRINYIPHHGVYHPQKKKIRVVFNCASKYKGLSLNDCLLPGPDLTNSIVGVLCRFRQFKVPFAADIEAMFYQVYVPEHQRDLLRFVWWEDGEPGNQVTTFRMKVHLFGATSSPSIANYALRRVAEEAQDPVIRDTILRNFYVDDCLKSVDTEAEAIHTAASLVKACSKGGFKLGKFLSNNLALLRTLDRSQLAKGMEELDFNEDKDDPLGSLQERALGVVWNVKDDRLGFKVSKSEDEQQTISRRKVLSRISQVYDPLGMAAPVIIVARVLFRELTKNGADWDDQLKTEDLQRWLKWLNNLKDIEGANISRWMGLNRRGRYQLHVFCDASTTAYAASAYLREVSESQEEADVTFVFGKARVTPPKVVTVPRLELTAAKLAADVATTIQEELEVTIVSRTLWSDSQTVLKYLSNASKRFHVFVTNKIEAILHKTEITEWRYVPTGSNPADEATRGLEAHRLKGSLWLNGPAFLRKSEDLWPRNAIDLSVHSGDPELKSANESVNYVQDEPKSFVDELAKRYSSATRFKRALAVWLRWKTKLKGGVVRSGAFQSQELEQAATAGIKWLQQEHWGDLSASMKRKWIRALTPQIHYGVLKMTTRTGDLLPIIPDSALARLLVKEAHETEGHMGRQSTAAAVRRKFWVVHLSKIVREVLRQCPSCQRRKSQLTSTIMADLPTMRLSPGPPFETTGIDYFGPFEVRDDAVPSRKAYGVIFTCAVSRAIHLELALGLDTPSFINALRRFCARRGSVRNIVSDNATNFVGTCNELQREVSSAIKNNRNNPDVIAELREKAVDWYFTPPEASHFGGFYERLIRCVKDVLSALLDPMKNRGQLTSDMLSTLLCECESILNNRPLTSVSGDPNDLEALTPNHLLLGRQAHGQGVGSTASYNDLAKALQCRWKLVQHLTANFWRRWVKEYKTLLYRRSKWLKHIGRPFRVNDVVLVKDSSTPGKDLGRLGRVIDVHPSIDGEVRVVDVNTAKGPVTRPITKLCLLETASKDA